MIYNTVAGQRNSRLFYNYPNEMPPANQGADSPNVSCTVHPDKARPPFVLRLPLVLHWLQRYLENHPGDLDTVLIAIRSPKPLRTPASTPSSIDSPSEPAPTSIPSQSVDKKIENNTGGDADLHDQNSRAVHNQDESLFVDPHGQGLSATQQGIGHVVPPYQACVESADESSGDSQPSGDLDDWLPTSEGDGGLNELSRQTAKPSTSQQSDKSPKRKQNYEGSRDPKRLHVEALDGTEVYIGSRSRQLSGTSELQSAPDQSDQTHGQQSDILEIGQDFHFVASSGTSPTASCSSRQISSMVSPIEENPSAESNVGFADLPADFQAKAQMIGDLATRENAWHFFNYMESLLSGPTDCSDTELNPSDDVPSTSSLDKRLRELKVGIIIQEKTEKHIKSMKILARVLKRVYLAELAGEYMKETAVRNAEPKKRRRKGLRPVSVKNRYTDLLFPETITCKSRQQSKEKVERLSKKEDSPRKKAKEKLEYWLSLGELLAMMAQRFGIGIILLLPKKLTDKDLHLFPQYQIKAFLDYINLLHPGLREHISNLSALLPGIVEVGLPSQRIVLETYSSDQLSELSNRPLKELFQPYTGIDSQRVYAVAAPPLGQDLSDVIYSEYPRPPAPQEGFVHPLTIDQQVDMAVKEPSQNGDLSDKPDHYRGPLHVNTSINSCQLSTTGDMPKSVYNSSFSVQTVDMPQEMGWPGNDQDTRTVNQRDLQLRAA